MASINTDSMHSNIDKEDSIPAVTKYVQKFGNEAGQDFLQNFMMSICSLVMSNNIFSFKNT